MRGQPPRPRIDAGTPAPVRRKALLMNIPPSPRDALHVPAPKIRAYVAALFEAVGMPGEDAALLAELLVRNDLRGVFSHGTRQVPAYVDHFRAGRLNPRPRPEVVAETAVTLTVTGDGGLGYFPALLAAQRVVAKAKTQGLAAALTRDHGHIDAAGLYARQGLPENLIMYVTSGHQLHLEPGRPLTDAAGGSPMAFAIPAGEQPPLVLDFGAMHDLYDNSPHRMQLFELSPGLVFRSIGLGAVCQALGGLLAGVPIDAGRAERTYPGANQGALLIALDPGCFMPCQAFVHEMEEYVARARRLAPMPGYEVAHLPGGPEWERERQWAESGPPLTAAHLDRLEALGQELQVPCPLRAAG
jgi:L-2-hydroxycarboxylate dehydrogenase (NAD+)